MSTARASQNPASAGQYNRHLVRHVDDSRACEVCEHAALHRRDERPLMAEVRRDRDDAAGREHDAQR
jgi:hypothetical protein